MPHLYSLLLNTLPYRFTVHWVDYPILDLSDVNAMEVIGSKSSIALGTFPLPSVIAGLQALVTKNMETLCKHSLLIPGIATGTTKLSLWTNKVESETKVQKIEKLVNTTEHPSCVGCLAFTLYWLISSCRISSASVYISTFFCFSNFRRSLDRSS